MLNFISMAAWPVAAPPEEPHVRHASSGCSAEAFRCQFRRPGSATSASLTLCLCCTHCGALERFSGLGVLCEPWQVMESALRQILVGSLSVHSSSLLVRCSSLQRSSLSRHDCWWWRPALEASCNRGNSGQSQAAQSFCTLENLRPPLSRLPCSSGFLWGSL